LQVNPNHFYIVVIILLVRGVVLISFSLRCVEPFDQWHDAISCREWLFDVKPPQPPKAVASALLPLIAEDGPSPAATVVLANINPRDRQQYRPVFSC
jgi:hypothetical protein